MPNFNGDDSWTLPLATRIVVGKDHHIVSIDYHADYTQRPEPEATLAEIPDRG